MPNQILRLPQVESRTGLKRSTIYERIAQGLFPRQIPLGGRAVGWLEADIEEWLSNQIALKESTDCINDTLERWGR